MVGFVKERLNSNDHTLEFKQKKLPDLAVFKGSIIYFNYLQGCC